MGCNILKFNSKKICPNCGRVLDDNEVLMLCDGVIGYYKELPSGVVKKLTCDKIMCKECSHKVAGNDFCDRCWRIR